MRATFLVVAIAAIGCGAPESPRGNAGAGAPATPVSAAVALLADAGSTAATRGTSVNARETEPWPAAVDRTLGTPNSQVRSLGTAADGRILISLYRAHAIAADEVRDPRFVGATIGVEYFAVLDAKGECIEETHLFGETLYRAQSGTVAEAIAILSSAESRAQMRARRELAARFGLHRLGPTVFGNNGFVALESNNQVYIARGEDMPFEHVKGGPAVEVTLSPDGSTLAYHQCRTPCGGVYRLTLLDVATQRTRYVPSGDLHESYWNDDSRSLVFTYDDSVSSLRDPTKFCLASLNVADMRVKTTRCFTARGGSSTRSPKGTFIGVRTDQKASRGRYTILRMPSAEEVLHLEDDPPIVDIDERGRMVWDDNQTPLFQSQVRLLSAVGDKLLPLAESGGFLPDGSVLVKPTSQPTHLAKSGGTLGDVGRCGHFAIWRPDAATIGR